MITFSLLASAMLVMALAMLLPPLLMRPAAGAGLKAQAAGTLPAQASIFILREQLVQADTELAAGLIDARQHAQARSEIERRALEEGAGLSPAQAWRRPARTAAMLALGIPLLALGLYGFLGNTSALQPQPEVPGAAGSEVTTQQIEAMVSQMAQRLENPPPGQKPDSQAWEMLARTYAALQRFSEADRAYAQAIALAPANAQLLADRADVLAMLQGQSAAGEPTRLVEQALKLEPDNLKALALAGSAAFERKDFAAATRYWSRARALAPPVSDFATGLDRSLEAARTGTAPAPPVEAAQTTQVAASPSPSPSPSPAQAQAGSLSGIVNLSPAMASKVAPDDTVFIFARAAQGPRMPLAILKRKASELPIRFVLDDSTAMSPALQLSRFAQVEVGVRVSKSGNAMPQSGDLVGQAGPLATGAANLVITINGVQP
ncbi:c-type cytochrome biogenesis protein CcmI [soil metagenome]